MTPRDVTPDMDDLVRVLTRACREADETFERVGGSTRHWVRDCFLPALAKHHLTLSDGDWVTSCQQLRRRHQTARLDGPRNTHDVRDGLESRQAARSERTEHRGRRRGVFHSREERLTLRVKASSLVFCHAD